MAYTVLQLMEKAGYGHEEINLVLEYIKDALWEFQYRGDADTHKTSYSIVANQRYYSLPSTLVNLQNVYQYNDDEAKYYPMARAMDRFIPDTDEETDSATP